MKCLFVKPNGDQCQANAMTSSDFCYTHNPEISEEEKREAKSKGGRNRSLAIINPLPPIKIEKTRDITALLVETINEVRGGGLDCRVANSIGYLAGVALKAYETSELEDRLDRIEIAIKN